MIDTSESSFLHRTLLGVLIGDLFDLVIFGKYNRGNMFNNEIHFTDFRKDRNLDNIICISGTYFTYFVFSVWNKYQPQFWTRARTWHPLLLCYYTKVYLWLKARQKVVSIYQRNWKESSFSILTFNNNIRQKLGWLLEYIYNNSYPTGNDFGGYNGKESNRNLGILYHF